MRNQILCSSFILIVDWKVYILKLWKYEIAAITQINISVAQRRAACQWRQCTYFILLFFCFLSVFQFVGKEKNDKTN